LLLCGQGLRNIGIRVEEDWLMRTGIAPYVEALTGE
jgi:hypothetical protein